MTRFRATAPSNIAFIKYWGKRDAATQWPANDSLSMTLSEATTTTTAELAASDSVRWENDLLPPDSAKARRVIQHLDWLRATLGFSEKLSIETKNTFPAGRGLASSASGMAALTIASLAAWTNSPDLDQLARAGFSRARLADLARMGSGSAARSLWGGFVRWNAGESSNHQQYLPLMSPQPWALADIILLGAAEKAISSSEGHRHAWSSPLFHTRLAGLPARIDQCLKAIDRHDLEMLGTILENEALEMHAIMMTSTPPIHYLSEKTLQLLTRVREERRRGHLHAYFTLDAGETIHMICEQKDSPRVASLLRELAPDRAVFLDHLGTGPELHTDAAAPRS